VGDGDDDNGIDDDGNEGDGSDAPVGVHVASIAAASRSTGLSTKQCNLAQAGIEKELLIGSGVQCEALC
jgi:hypothetical protein